MRSHTSHGRSWAHMCAAVGVLFLPAAAHAGAVALSPLLADSSVTPDERLGVHQVLSSELDFAPEIDGVFELDRVPSRLDDWCLTSAWCLQGISSSHEAEGLLAGRMRGAGEELVLDLVFFDQGSIVRRQAFRVPRDPTGLATSMTAVVRQVLTGEDPTADDGPTEEDFELEEEAFVLEPEREQLDPAERALLDDEMDASAIQFGSVTLDEVSISELPEGRAEEAGSGGVEGGTEGGVVGPTQPLPDRRAEPDTAADRARTATSGSPRARTARQSPATSTAGSSRQASRTRAPTPRVEREGDRTRRVRVAARGGYGRYYSFDFVTGGGEVLFRAADRLDLLVGIEAWSVNRVLPPDVAIERGVYSAWDTIFPMNAGLLYRFDAGAVQPYLGADGILVQYYRDEVGGDWAVGARARLGLDYMVTAAFGLNVDLAAGGWSGRNWGIIEQGVGRSGFVPQVSGGALFAF